MSKKNKNLSRRKLLQQSAGICAAAAFSTSCIPEGGTTEFGSTESQDSGDQIANEPRQLPIKDRKFLIVLTAFGGGSIIDSAMALSRDEVQAAGGNPDTLNCFAPEQLVDIPDSNIRAVKLQHTITALGNVKVDTDQSDFIRNNFKDMTVVTSTGTSVNHVIAQQRSLTGNNAWNGRTIQEAVANQYGAGLPIANLNMGSGAYGFAGIDSTIAKHAQQFLVNNPLYWPLGLSSTEKLNQTTRRDLLNIAKNFRMNNLDINSNFFKTFKDQEDIKKWIEHRETTIKEYESQKLMEKLFFNDENTNDPEIAKVKEVFPDFKNDPLEAQAILGYLAITRNTSCTITLGPSSNSLSKGSGFNFVSTPIAFDFSHNDHRGTQAMMWSRIYSVADRLVKLLKETQIEDSGSSYWDNSLLYIASDFGRSKQRSSGADIFPSGHDLNNGSIIISPMIKGNRYLGGIDAKTGLTYGYDIKTGQPTPNRSNDEVEFFSTLASALKLDLKGSGLDFVDAV